MIVSDLLDNYLQKNGLTRLELAQHSNLKRSLLANMNGNTKQPLPLENWKIQYLTKIGEALNKKASVVLEELEELQQELTKTYYNEEIGNADFMKLYPVKQDEQDYSVVYDEDGSVPIDEKTLEFSFESEDECINETDQEK